jgi:hypothetical protein
LQDREIRPVVTAVRSAVACGGDRLEDPSRINHRHNPSPVSSEALDWNHSDAGVTPVRQFTWLRRDSNGPLHSPLSAVRKTERQRSQPRSSSSGRLDHHVKTFFRRTLRIK